MEENFELLQSLENVSRLSFEIQIIYSRLTLLEVSKDITENYEQEKKGLLDQLALLLEEEKDVYSYFEQDYYQTEYALEFIRKRFNQNLPEKYLLVQKRILNKLETILLDEAIEREDTEYLEEYLEEDFYADLFLDQGLSLEDIIPIIKDLSIPIEESLSRHYITTINEDIKNPSNFDIRRLLINAKFDYVYEHSEKIEKECLNQSFNNIKGSLSEETSLPNVSSKLIKDYYHKHLKDKLLDMLIVCGSCTDLDMVIPEIAWFKTYLLYLNKEDIIDINNRLIDYTFQNQDIKDILLKAIKNNDLLKSIHNQTSYQK